MAIFTRALQWAALWRCGWRCSKPAAPSGPYCRRNNRKEIHVIGYQPTKLANTDLFGGNNDNSSVSGKKYYISKDNLAWGIMVPTDFKWTLEYVNIKTVYSLFTDWVTSGGVKNQEWWKTFDSSKVYK